MELSFAGRAPAQRERILAALREAGITGVLNTELYKICLRPSARVYELRRMGFEIAGQCEGDGIFRFTLKLEPHSPKPLPKFAARPKQRRLPLFTERGGGA
jgi:helix-turn-helix protein